MIEAAAQADKLFPLPLLLSAQIHLPAGRRRARQCCLLMQMVPVCGNVNNGNHPSSELVESLANLSWLEMVQMFV